MPGSRCGLAPATMTARCSRTSSCARRRATPALWTAVLRSRHSAARDSRQPASPRAADLGDVPVLFLVVLPATRGTETVRELGLRPLGDICLEGFPVTCLGSDALAECADGEQAFQPLDVSL